MSDRRISRLYPHQAWFQNYASTSIPDRSRPASVAEIGHSDRAAHQSIAPFAPRNPASVNFIKVPSFQDGHAGYSEPLEEHTFLVNRVTFL